MSLLPSSEVLANPNYYELRSRMYQRNINIGGAAYPFWGVKRPYVNELLIFCFSHFKIVGVWSAGKKEYVDEIVKIVFGDIQPPHIVFSHDDIDHYDDHVVKDLQKMFQQPIFSKYMNEYNTLIIDDLPETFCFNPQNGVAIPPYKPSPMVDAMIQPDMTLLQLRAWLLNPEVINCSDVAMLDKENIFSLAPAAPQISLRYQATTVRPTVRSLAANSPQQSITSPPGIRSPPSPYQQLGSPSPYQPMRQITSPPSSYQPMSSPPLYSSSGGQYITVMM